MSTTRNENATRLTGLEQTRATSMFAIQDYLILGAAGISFVFSVLLWFSGQGDAGIFVGLWVPSILGLGGYVKANLRGARP